VFVVICDPPLLARLIRIVSDKRTRYRDAYNANLSVA